MLSDNNSCYRLYSSKRLSRHSADVFSPLLPGGGRSQEYIKVAKLKGEGWTEYMYPTPEELKKDIPFKEMKSSKKISFVYRVPGKDLMVIAGFFE